MTDQCIVPKVEQAAGTGEFPKGVAVRDQIPRRQEGCSSINS